MATTIRYPVFLIANLDGIVAARINGKDCIMLFHAKYLAERQIEMIESSHPLLGVLFAVPIRSAEALRNALELLRDDTTLAVWNPVSIRAGFTHVAIDDLIRAVESG